MAKKKGFEIPISITKETSSGEAQILQSLENIKTLKHNIDRIDKRVLSTQSKLISLLENQRRLLEKSAQSNGNVRKFYNEQYKYISEEVRLAKQNSKSAEREAMQIPILEKKKAYNYSIAQLLKKTSTYLDEIVRLDTARLTSANQINEAELSSEDFMKQTLEAERLRVEKQRDVIENLAEEKAYRENIAGIKYAKYQSEGEWREIKKELDYEEKLAETRRKAREDFQKTLTLKQEQKSAENQITLSLLQNQELLNQDLEIRKARASLDAQKSALLLQDEQYQKDIITRKNNEYKLEQKINKELDKKNKKTNKFVDALWRVGKTLTSLYTIRRVFSLMKTVVDQSSQWIENLNLFETAFGGYTSEALDSLTEFANKMGISNNQIIKVTGNFQELANTVGLVAENSSRASIALTRVGYDIASLRNLDFDTIFEKLQSVIYGGQVKTARTLGINVSAEGLEELMKEVTGLDVSFRNLSERQKVLLRMIATFKQLGSEGADTFGDLGETITSLANRIRVFQGSFENLKQAIGDVFSDWLSDVVATASAIVQAITSIIRAFKPLETESGFNDTAEGIQNITEETEELEKTLGLLDIDKFSVLGSANGASQEDSQFTNALYEELDKQINKYEETANAVAGFDKKVIDLRNDIIKFIFPLSEMNEETGLIEPNLKQVNFWLLQIKDLITTLISLAIVKKIMNIPIALKELSEKLKTLKIDIDTFKLSFLSLTMVISSVLSLLTNPNLTGGQKLIAFLVALTASIAGLIIALSLLGMNWAKALSVAGLIGGGVLSVANTIGSIGKFEKGGIPKQGSLYFAGEGKGAELLGNVGGRTNVINEGQLGQVLYNSYKRANAENRNNVEGGNSRVVLNVNGRELAKTIFNDINYVGKTNTGKSWGNN